MKTQTLPSRRLRLGFLFATALAVLPACSGRQFGADWMDEESDKTAQGEVKIDVQALMDRAEAIWLERHRPEIAQQCYEIYKSAAEADPNHARALARASNAAFVVGEYFTEDKAKKLELFNEGINFAERALATDPEFKKRVLDGDSVEEAVDALSLDYIDAIYWTATNLGKWAVNAGFVKVISNKNKIRSLIDKVYAMDETYDHGAALRYLGAYYAKVPAFAGGDLEISKSYFDRAVEVSPNNLATHLVKAEFYCLKLQKADEGGKACFIEALDKVLDTPADIVPELKAANILAKRRAEPLRPQADKLFAFE